MWRGSNNRDSTGLISCFALLFLAPFSFLQTGDCTGTEMEYGPGDMKKGYASPDYKTRSLSLQRRTGKPANLMQAFVSPPLGLPPVPVPEDNQVTEAKVLLGRKLYYDRRLSLNNTMSCAMCHIPEQGFTSNELATAVGIEGRTVRRNAPTLYNAAYFANFFHDGREIRLEYQIWGPMLAANEMGAPSIGWVVKKISRIPDYQGLFENAFAGHGVSPETIGMAIACYERTLVSASSPFDRWYYGGNGSALSDEAKEGFILFTGKAGCGICHLINEDYALFTDDLFHSTGLGWQNSVGEEPDAFKIQLAPGVKARISASVVASVGEPPPSDLGRYEVTHNPADLWLYKTPTLRNVALTAPYMHNGFFPTLREIVVFYNQGGIPHPQLDPLIRPLGLTDREVDNIVAFLEALTGNNIEILVQDAFAAPIGN